MIGSIFSNYQIIHKIGGGNTGVVYKVFDPLHHRFAALKILPDSLLVSNEQKARFMREVKAAGILSHEAIAALYDAGEHEETPFIAMEFVDGQSYKQIIEQNPDGVEVSRFLDLTLPILEGLAYAHELGLVHRDLKPDNLKITAQGQPKILDFGLVKFLGDPPISRGEGFQTMAGKVLGSAGYMSPEQAEGGSFDARTDVFNLGIIMYELLTGKNPYASGSPFGAIVKIINSEPLSLELVRSDLSLNLCGVILKCLTKNMNGRYPDASAVLNAFHGISP